MEPDPKPPIRGEGQLLQAMLAHWTHEDNLYWTQIRHLLVLQLAVAAAWFAVGPSLLGAVVMFLASGISAYFYRLASIVQRNRDANLEAIAILSETVASKETQHRLLEKDGSGRSWGIFRFALHPLGTSRDEGRRFHRAIFGVCFALNLTVGMVTAHAWLFEEHSVLRYIHPKFDRSSESY